MVCHHWLTMRRRRERTHVQAITKGRQLGAMAPGTHRSLLSPLQAGLFPRGCLRGCLGLDLRQHRVRHERIQRVRLLCFRLRDE